MNVLGLIRDTFYVRFPEAATVDELAEIRLRLARRDCWLLSLFAFGALAAFAQFAFPIHMYLLMLCCGLASIVVAVRMSHATRHRHQVLGTLLAGILIVGVTWFGATASGLVYYLALAAITSYSIEHARLRHAAYGVFVLAFVLALYRFRDEVGIYVHDPQAIMEISVTDVAICVLAAGLLLRIHTDYGLMVAHSAWRATETLRERVADSRQANAEIESANVKAVQASRATAAALRAELQAAAQLRASAEQLEQFAYAASHDLKEPVRTIKSFTQLAQRRFAKTSTVQDEVASDVAGLFDQISADAESMHELLERLLAYSRAGRAQPALVTGVAPATILERLAVLAASKGDTPDIVAHGAELPTLDTDVALLNQALAELLANALAFGSVDAASGHRTPLELGVLHDSQAGNVVFWVRDHGPGVSAVHREGLFGMFRRLRTFPDAEGAGMGLAIARTLARKLGGDVELRSPVEGRGTEAVLWVPCPRRVDDGCPEPGARVVEQ